MRSVWDLQTSISQRLLVWSGLSISAGLMLIFLGNSFWKGFGVQAAAWGGIDAAIALLSILRINRRRSIHGSPEHMSQEARKLKRLLLVNFRLDFAYIAIGIALAYLPSGASWQGHGWGIIIQGGFLLFFDFIHAQTVPPLVNPKPLQAFHGSEHLPFSWIVGKPAALLIHGFPGTPAEMRPLGKALHQAGWSVEGILLPGFGSEIATLDERSYAEWILAVDDSLNELKNDHSPVILVGYSMGGAVSIISAANCRPDGLVLIAPFWRMFPPMKSFIGTVLKSFLPRYFQPFKEFDLSDPKVQSGIRNFLPHVDLNDPEVQDDISHTIVPVSLLDQQLTLKLKEHLAKDVGSGEVKYVEVDAEHDILSESSPSWTTIEKSILDFAGHLKNQSG